MVAKDYVDYLTANVLNDGQTVSYRGLSRALKVHANLAKQMLYDFHDAQNKQKPKTLHATYLITGRQTISLPHQEAHGTESQDGPETGTRSSPALSSQHEARQYAATSVLLVDQDNLDNAKAAFDDILSLHMYSVQPTKINNLHVLSECNRLINAAAAAEDLLHTSKDYGIIQNGQVKRRPMRKTPHQNQLPPKPTSSMTSKSTKPTKPSFAPTKAADKDASTSTKSTPHSSQASTQASTKAASTKTAPLKREGSSLFKAFAKAKPKAQSQATDSEASATESANKEDEPMHDLSDEDADEEDATMLDEGAITDTAGKSKKERQEELRRMMDMEDEPMVDAPTPTMATAAETPEDANDETDPKPESQTKEEPQETVTVTDGRRRGRRRVMKKKTVQDEEGYLVTREEPGWESFSEDEPAPKKAKVSAAPPTAKTKKAAPKGQGNIMSFFSKK